MYLLASITFPVPILVSNASHTRSGLTLPYLLNHNHIIHTTIGAANDVQSQKSYELYDVTQKLYMDFMLHVDSSGITVEKIHSPKA
jgi:hypothetical protein